MSRKWQVVRRLTQTSICTPPPGLVILLAWPKDDLDQDYAVFPVIGVTSNIAQVFRGPADYDYPLHLDEMDGEGGWQYVEEESGSDLVFMYEDAPTSFRFWREHILNGNEFCEVLILPKEQWDHQNFDVKVEPLKSALELLRKAVQEQVECEED